MTDRLALYFKSRGAMVEGELKRLMAGRKSAPIPFLRSEPATLREAMAYSLFAGGKRLRPVLLMAASECCGLGARRCLEAACGMEMIHTYSLIHDDLPAMDDDDLRRGKPTNHKVFGEALAILAGDGLLTKAFELVARNARRVALGAKETADLVEVVAAGAGARGMVGGQAADLEAEGLGALRNGSRAKGIRLLEYIHTHKTAALITASLEAGALLARADAPRRRALREYGRAVGLAFQIADDILDVVGDKEKLGKRGSDEANAKLTYVRLFGVEGSRRKAAELAGRARKSLSVFGRRAAVLHDLADYIITREK